MDDEQRTLSAGVTVLIGAPAKPMAESRMALLRAAVQGVPDVVRAYVPQVYIPNEVDPPRQILFLIIREEARERVGTVVEEFAARIRWRMPADEFIDIWPVFADDELLPDITRTGCVLDS